MVVAQGYLGDFDGGDAVQEPASQVHLGAHVARPIHVHIHRLAMRSYDNHTTTHPPLAIPPLVDALIQASSYDTFIDFFLPLWESNP